MSLQTKISPLQLYKQPVLPAGLTESHHLSQAYLTQPELIESAMAYAFGTQGKSVVSLITGGLGNIKFIENREYEWPLHGQTDRAIFVTGNLADGGSTPGIGGTAFRVRMEEKWFSETDVLVSDNGTAVRVQSEPYLDGAEWVYSLVLMDPDPSKFIASTEIAAGARFSKDFSTVSEYSDKGGSTNFQAPTKLRNHLTTLRKSFSVTRSAATDVMIIELFHPETKEKTKLWTKLAEWNALSQWQTEIDKSLVYSIYSKNPDTNENVLKSTNGRPVYVGAGLRQQIAPSNIRYYSTLSYNMLDEFLLSLSYAGSLEGGHQKFTILTGKMGMRQFSNAISEKAKSTGFTVLNGSGQFITGSGNKLEFAGDQFITASFPNGVSCTVVEFPAYDNPIRNRTIHPTSGMPIESYRMTIINTSGGTTSSGIKKVAKKNSDNAMWYTAGSTDPFGGVSKSMSTLRSSGKDGYEVHFLAELGLMLENPLACGELIFDATA